jgi:hypothetical protein
MPALIVAFFVTLLVAVPANASVSGTKEMELRVDGRFLKDGRGRTVRLMGFHETPHPIFTGLHARKLIKKPRDPQTYVDYFKRLIDVMTDPSPRYGSSHGWHANQLRINPSAHIWGDHRNVTENILVPVAAYAATKGVYIILVEEGLKGQSTTPETLASHLETWDYWSSHPGLRNAPNVHFELTNEPIRAQAGDGTWGGGKDLKYHIALVEWLQPLVDKIRSNGARNLIWVPGLGWQSAYQHFATKTISDPENNFGYAVHLYPAYGGVFNSHEKLKAFWISNYKPVADTHPVNITEIRWKKMLPGDHKYHRLFNGVTGDENSGFGTGVHSILKEYPNVSMAIHLASTVFEKGDPEKLRDDGEERDSSARPFFEWQYEFRNR